MSIFNELHTKINNYLVQANPTILQGVALIGGLELALDSLHDKMNLQAKEGKEPLNVFAGLKEKIVNFLTQTNPTIFQVIFLLGSLDLALDSLEGKYTQPIEEKAKRSYKKRASKSEEEKEGNKEGDSQGVNQTDNQGSISNKPNTMSENLINPNLDSLNQKILVSGSSNNNEEFRIESWGLRGSENKP